MTVRVRVRVRGRVRVRVRVRDRDRDRDRVRVRVRVRVPTYCALTQFMAMQACRLLDFSICDWFFANFPHKRGEVSLKSMKGRWWGEGGLTNFFAIGLKISSGSS